MSTNGNAAALWIIESCQQAANRCFSGTGWPYNCSRGFFWNAEADIFQDRSFRFITELYLFKLDVIMLKRNICSIRIDEMLPFQGIQLIHGIFNHTKRMRAIAD